MGRVEKYLNTSGLADEKWQPLRSDGMKYIITSERKERVYYSQIFPTLEAYGGLNSGRVPAGDKCCVCGVPAPRRSVAWPRTFLEYCFALLKGPAAIWVPTCEEHSSRRARCVIHLRDWWSKYPLIEFYTLNESFCTRFEFELTLGEYYPPWVAFPHCSPFSSWGQGTNQVWLIQWATFWRRLGIKEREQYLAKWPASPAWVEAIQSGRLDEISENHTAVAVGDPDWEDYLRSRKSLK